MFRAILAAIGVLLIFVGIKLDEGVFFAFSVIFLLPAVITIIVKIIVKLVRWRRRVIQMEKYKKKQAEVQMAEEERKLSLLKAQKDLLERYKSSELTKKLISYICNGTPEVEVPERIVIFDDRVEAILHGQTRVFDFASRRIHHFGSVTKTVWHLEELKYVVRPQVAMAEAINFLLSNQYMIDDSANRKNNYHTDSDGNGYTSILYTSKYVTLTLKSTLPNQSF